MIRLDTGLTVIHQHVPSAPVVVTDVWLQAGAIAEPAEWCGMAHFLEHMIFKGTSRLAPGAFDQIIEAHGGMSNAATSHDYAHYFTITASENVAATLPYLAELLLHAAIPADEFIRERAVVLEEIRQAHDNPDWLGLQALATSLFPDHAYGRPVLGAETTLRRWSPEEMRCFHRAHYQPENMTVVMVGDVDLDTALVAVEQSFSIPSSSSGYSQPLERSEPCCEKGPRRQILHLPRLECARLLMGWCGPGINQLSQACGLDLLAVLLAEGRSSRLVRCLREEKQLVHEITSSFSLQRDASLFTISTWLDSWNLEQVEEIICAHLLKLTATSIAEAEIRRCKRLLWNDHVFSTETPGQLADLYGYYGTIAQPELSVVYPYQTQVWSTEELRELANQYLSPDHYAVVIMEYCA